MPFDLLNQKCLFDHPIPVACSSFETLEAGFRIRIHFLRIRIRIRIQRIQMEANTDPDTDPDPDPIRIQGFNDQKLKKNNSWKKN
jgi:hypothetical protein